jgi:secreted Zn-dependent insulinase-like peptidase
MVRNLVIVSAPPVSSASLTKIPVIKSQLDPLNYTAFKLPNNLEFMVVIDPSIQTDMVYAWSVHAGELESPP